MNMKLLRWKFDFVLLQLNTLVIHPYANQNSSPRINFYNTTCVLFASTCTAKQLRPCIIVIDI